MDGFKKPGTNILSLFSLQCDKIQCQSGTTMTAALYGRWVDWPHISVEILPSLVFNECSHVFFAGQQDNKNIPICQCWPPSCLVGQETHAILTFTCQFFFRILYERRPELECNWMKKKLEVKKTQRSNWRWFSASCSASFLKSHHVRCCRLEWGSWGIRGDHRQSDEADIRTTSQSLFVENWK